MNFKLHCKTGPRRVLSAAAVLLLVLFVFLSSCKPAEQPQSSKAYSHTLFVFDTVVTITTYEEKDEKAVNRAMTSLADYDRIFSRTDPESELYRLNEAAGTETAVSGDLYAVLEAALKIASETNGAFDFTLGGVSDLYGFVSRDYRVPSSEELKEALSHTGYAKVRLNPGKKTVTVSDPDLKLDLGAIAKGYAADRLREQLVKDGVRRAIINIGGNIQLIGNKSGTADASALVFSEEKQDGLFTIGIKDPDSETPLKKLYLAGYSVVTSGNYERFFDVDGVRYHHILDPATGLPVRNDLLSVTIIAGNSCLADALSTACFVLGESDSQDLLKNYPDLRAVFAYSDKTLSDLP